MRHSICLLSQQKTISSAAEQTHIASECGPKDPKDLRAKRHRDKHPTAGMQRMQLVMDRAGILGIVGRTHLRGRSPICVVGSSINMDVHLWQMKEEHALKHLINRFSSGKRVFFFDQLLDHWGIKMKERFWLFTAKKIKKMKEKLYNLAATRFGAFHTSGNFSLAFKWNLIKAATTKGNNKRNEQQQQLHNRHRKLWKFFIFFTTNYRMAFHLAFSPTTKAPFTRRLNYNNEHNNKWVEWKTLFSCRRCFRAKRKRFSFGFFFT